MPMFVTQIRAGHQRNAFELHLSKRFEHTLDVVLADTWIGRESQDRQIVIESASGLDDSCSDPCCS
jgi:hypothetical protein